MLIYSRLDYKASEWDTLTQEPSDSMQLGKKMSNMQLSRDTKHSGSTLSDQMMRSVGKHVTGHSTFPKS